MLNRLLDGGERGFVDGINASQYQKVAKVSKATATRHHGSNNDLSPMEYEMNYFMKLAAFTAPHI